MVSRQRVAQARVPSGGAASHRTVRWSKQARRVEDLVRIRWKEQQVGCIGPPSWRLQQLWDKCRRIGQGLCPEEPWTPYWSAADVPTLATLRGLARLLRAQVKTQIAEDRHARSLCWKEWAEKDWEGSKTGVYRWCKNKEVDQLCMLQQLDGSFTADCLDMQQHVEEAWLPLFRMYATAEEPSWEDFVARFGRYFPERVDMPDEPLTVDTLRATLSRMKTTSSPGPDGWSVSELRALPGELLLQLVELLTTVASGGEWPGGIAERGHQPHIKGGRLPT